jgi:hypothetical protein
MIRNWKKSKLYLLFTLLLLPRFSFRAKLKWQFMSLVAMFVLNITFILKTGSNLLPSQKKGIQNFFFHVSKNNIEKI